MGRVADHAGILDPLQRVALAERDLDLIETKVDRGNVATRAEIKELRADMETWKTQINNRLMGMLIALATSAVLLGLDLTVGQR